MNPVQSIVQYIRSSKAELEKVAWPSRQDTLRYSLLVVAVSVITAVFFAVLDFGLNAGVEKLLSRRAGTAQTAPSQPPITVTPDIQATTPNGSPADVKVTPIVPATK